MSEERQLARALVSFPSLSSPPPQRVSWTQQESGARVEEAVWLRCGQKQELWRPRTARGCDQMKTPAGFELGKSARGPFAGAAYCGLFHASSFRDVHGDCCYLTHVRAERPAYSVSHTSIWSSSLNRRQSGTYAGTPTDIQYNPGTRVLISTCRYCCVNTNAAILPYPSTSERRDRTLCQSRKQDHARSI